MQRATLVLGVAVCLAALALHAYPVFRPMLWDDDFQILAKSLTWSSTQANLWLPANEHAMPLGRLITWGLVQFAGRPTVFPQAAAFQGPLALAVGILLLYLFVRRELGHPFYGLAASAFFGISSGYHQAVGWFAASFSVLALDTLLLALLAAQRWQRTGKAVPLMLCLLAGALAPAWFASGILVGPLCCVYLLLVESQTRRQGDKETGRQRAVGLTGLFVFRSPRLLVSLTPLLGSAIFLAVSLPKTAAHIMHLEHYGTKTAWEAFHLRVGVVNTARSLVDNLALGAVGIGEITCPLFLVPIVLALLAFITLWWWRPLQSRSLLFLGLAFILLSYLLVYSARAEWGYDEAGFYRSNWGRYQLLPQVGLALMICGGLPRWNGKVFTLDPAGTLSLGQSKAIGLLVAILFITQLPRGILATPAYSPEQSEALRQIEEMDARCQAYHISAEAARQVLARLRVPCSGEKDNGWDLLRGSDAPQPMPPEEVRRFLDRVEPSL